MTSRFPRQVMLTTDTVGGVWRYTMELAAGFARSGARVMVVTMGPPPDASQRAELHALRGVRLIQASVQLDWLAKQPYELKHASHELCGIARTSGTETIQIHTPALAAGPAWPAPVVVMAHSCVGTWWRAVRGSQALPPEFSWHAEAVAQGLRAADAVLAPSKSFATALFRRYGELCGIRVIPNGRSLAAVPRQRCAQALTVGRLWDEGKNVAVLDAAAADLPVYAVGPVEGPNGASISPHNLRLLGVMDDAGLAQEYATAAVFVSVSRYEPFGLAVLEAAQAGCALLLSDIPTFRELWDGAALFVDPCDIVGLRSALATLLQAPHQCEQLGHLARERSASYSVERMVERTWAVHREALETRGKVAA
ncbi:MAG: glycosyltransferase family 4 protein [Acetobacteraceae bacterium]|nr:glycosyltransferase family 4 protein [Acetobacteraceae bacterium]